ncbi:MAG: hypothetical protein AB7R89_14605 [Dehalococcoidia bacterium]
MAQVLLLGTWLVRPEPAADDVIAAGKDIRIGGMSGQMLLTGSKIVVKRPWIVDERTWKHGMARAVQDGEIQELTDEQMVVVDAKPEAERGQGRRR